MVACRSISCGLVCSCLETALYIWDWDKPNQKCTFFTERRDVLGCLQTLALPTCLPVSAHSYSRRSYRLRDLASFSLTRGGPLSARWMVSASVGEVTAVGLGPFEPRVWILSGDSFWQLLMGDTSTSPPSRPWACIMETPASRKINDVAQWALMKCKWCEPHPGGKTPELRSAMK